MYLFIKNKKKINSLTSLASEGNRRGKKRVWTEEKKGRTCMKVVIEERRINSKTIILHPIYPKLDFFLTSINKSSCSIS
jgi:hypothetical protein